MAETLPLVTLGVPVYNEASFVKESLENMLQQTYPNIEILIADNGSTDGTSELCEDYARKHANIVHIRHPKNLGQQANFNFLPRKAKGKYFCWASAHDLLEPDFVEKCVKAFEALPTAVLAYPRTMYMTKGGRPVREKPRHFDITKMDAAQRFLEVMWRVDCNYVYGMFKLEPMLQSHIFQKIPAADRVFLSEMALKGPFVPADTMKYYRDNRENVQTEIEKRHRLMNYIDPSQTYTDAQLKGNAFYLPTRNAFFAVAAHAGFPWITKLRVYFEIWLSGVIKSHLFPGADALSALVKTLLPGPLMRKIMQRIQ